MKLQFSYNIDKDIENFQKGAHSINNPKPTKFHQLYMAKFGNDLEDPKIRAFIEGHIKEQNIDVSSRISKIEADWLTVRDEFVKRCERIFGIVYPEGIITVYLTTNNRCTYNTKEGYFFVHMQSTETNRTVMHELLHFYTQAVFYDDLKKSGLTDMQYNDIKESLTELLNIEFADLMPRVEDRGYPQHQEMRAKIRRLWLETRDIHKVVIHLR